MTTPRTTTWELEPHTRAKHQVLRRYLQAWFPILARKNEEMVYLDGFAGPGRYASGEDGSPLIALKAARGHFARLRNKKLFFIFVEEDAERATWLREVEIPELKLPEHFVVRVINRSFPDVLDKVVTRLEARGRQSTPTFALIDPFGIRDVPFALLASLLRRPRCEALLTFMTNTVQRFPAQIPEHINALFGLPDAAERIARAHGDRLATIRDLYTSQLKSVSKHVRFFSVKAANGNAIYDLFYTTQHPLGLLKMKEAMSAASSSADFTYSAGHDPSQLMLLPADPAPSLARWLLSRFEGQRVRWEEVEAAVIVERVHDLPAHARAALNLLEERSVQMPGHIEVEATREGGRKRRRRDFPTGTWIRFSGGPTHE